MAHTLVSMLAAHGLGSDESTNPAPAIRYFRSSVALP
jgi:hypothetical protein